MLKAMMDSSLLKLENDGTYGNSKSRLNKDEFS
jgi:hypothetical protein